MVRIKKDTVRRLIINCEIECSCQSAEYATLLRACVSGDRVKVLLEEFDYTGEVYVHALRIDLREAHKRARFILRSTERLP